MNWAKKHVCVKSCFNFKSPHPCQEVKGHAGVSLESCFAPAAQRCSLSHNTILFSAVWGLWYLMIVLYEVENAPFPTGSPPLISLIRPESLCHVQPAGRPANARMKLL